VTTHRGALVRWAHGVVIDWTLHITSGLPSAVAEDRFDQIVSDLWEQEHLPAGPRGLPLALALLLRAARGLPADLAWRHSVLKDAPAVAPVTAKAWRPLLQDGKPFDQTNGAVELDDEPARGTDASDARTALEKGAASAAAFGYFTGGGSGF